VLSSHLSTALRRNRLTFDRLALCPQVLVDVSTVDRSTAFLGHRLRIPVMLAPLDHGEGTLDVLPEIIDVVGDAAEVVVDSGILWGTDVIKALALGARAVAIGKLQGLGARRRRPGWRGAGAGNPG
jgi:isopentenyl diphosphate isomerase/L-lactate dehydrogenase-like FMN-dependent dehydrogenase